MKAGSVPAAKASDEMTDKPVQEETPLSVVDEGECEIRLVIERAMSRRRFLGTATAFGAVAAVSAKTGMAAAQGHKGSRLTFNPVAANTLDTVTVPEGYDWQVLMSWGDPLWPDGKPFDQASRGTAASQARAFGDNTDGMALFTHKGRSILAVNNEYANLNIMFGNRSSLRPESEDDIRKSMMAHGVTICEIAEDRQGRWSVVEGSPYNRRITAETPMEITGPAAGHDLLKTAADPFGRYVKGTFNNCANGRTPWGTYLTCEENFNGYFFSSDAGLELGSAQKRYGIGHEDRGYGWARADERFDIARHPNEAHRFGYVVEIDPLDPRSVPKKRTALGRFKHENAELVINGDGRAVVYLGDDERGEFLYKFVSDGRYAAGGDNRTLLDSGTLYVARFNDDFSGEWLALTPETTGMSQAEICVFTRLAASKLRPTTMDRPEWVAAHPRKAEVYCCLTNNKNRGKKPNAGGDATPVGGPNPRKGNKYGQIVRWWPEKGNHAASGFTWDLFAVAGNPVVHEDERRGSANVTAENMFNSPDGLKFSDSGLLWILTDGSYSNTGDFEGMGNNQMLAADPDTGEIARFMVGPRECEITGIAWSADRRTMFVGIQHPGEKGNSHFPGGGDSVPRSSIVAIRRKDGAVIG